MRQIKGIPILFVFILAACSTEKGQDIKPLADSLLLNQKSNIRSVRVDRLDASRFKILLKQHEGKVLFINAWATWCAPCKEEFPDLVKLAEEYAHSDVAVIGISVDYPDEIESKIIPFLQDQRVNFPNFVQNFKRPEDLINLFNEKWRGAVPATFIYDKKGQQRSFLLGKQSYEQFKAEIESVRSES